MYAVRCAVRVRRSGGRPGEPDQGDVDGFAGSDVAVVATGHTAPLMLPDLHTVRHYDQHLTLDGLRMVYERNRDNQRGRIKSAR